MTSYLHFSGAPVPFNLFRLDVPCLSHHRICLKQLRTEEIIREFHKPLSSVLHMGLSDNVCVCVRALFGGIFIVQILCFLKVPTLMNDTIVMHFHVKSKTGLSPWRWRRSEMVVPCASRKPSKGRGELNFSGYLRPPKP